MTTDLMHFDWLIRENPLLTPGNPQKFTAIPPENSRFRRRSYPTLEAAEKAIDRRVRCRSKASSSDQLLRRMLATRREVKVLQLKLDAAVAAASLATKAFLEQEQMTLPGKSGYKRRNQVDKKL